MGEALGEGQADYAARVIPTFRYNDQKSEKDWILIERWPPWRGWRTTPVIDLHPCTRGSDKPEYPDWSVIDLDPAEGAHLPQVVQVARLVNPRSGGDQSFELKALLKTTGQRGLHIYVPMSAATPWTRAVSSVAKLARMIQTLLPDLVTEVWEVKRRTGRSGSITPRMSSTRGPPLLGPAGGTRAVSTPISWDELDDPSCGPTAGPSPPWATVCWRWAICSARR